MVIDPLTAIGKAGALGAARTVANRLIYAVKDEEITLMVTALSETDSPGGEATDLQISTIADTWIHLSYLVRSGERNRALTIVKSLRWEKEAEESASEVRHTAEFEHKRRELQFAEVSTSAQIKALQLDLERQRAELALYSGERDVRVASSSQRESELRRRRGAEPKVVARKSGNGAAE